MGNPIDKRGILDEKFFAPKTTKYKNTHNRHRSLAYPGCRGRLRRSACLKDADGGPPV